jgi:CheY-like chemotaxis protein
MSNTNNTIDFNPKSYSILLAEDDVEDQELIMEAFASTGENYRLKVFSDGKSALHYLESCESDHLPCLIVLDYNMPEMTGSDVLKKISGQKKYISIPKVILSTAKSDMFVQECLRHGADAYKVKPSTFNELVDVVKEMLSMCKTPA